jgi:hypothetical protein
VGEKACYSKYKEGRCQYEPGEVTLTVVREARKSMGERRERGKESAGMFRLFSSFALTTRQQKE